MSDLPAGQLDDEFDEGECENEEFAGWEEVDIGDGTTELMPPEDRYEFRDHVEVIAVASGAAGSIGPMTQEHREYICCFGDVYLVRSENDWGYSNTIVGRNVSLEECVERSQAFVIGGGAPVGAWSDEDIDGDIGCRVVGHRSDCGPIRRPPVCSRSRNAGGSWRRCGGRRSRWVTS